MLRISLLITAALIWGIGFVGTRWTFVDYSAIWSNSLRFLFAGSIALPILWFRGRYLLKNKEAFICAILLAVGLQLQTIGIEHTTLAKSGFLTVFYALFTPLLVLFIDKISFKKTYWVLVATSMFGIALICDLDWSQFNKGDAYILLSALFFALHIVAIDKVSQKHHAILFNLAQCFYIGLVCVAFGLIVEGPVSLKPLYSFAALSSPSSLWGFIILSVFSSIIAFSLQIYAQQGIAPHIVSLVFLLESIFATIFGYLIFNESLSRMGIIGCVIVLASVSLIPKCTNYEKRVEGHNG